MPFTQATTIRRATTTAAAILALLVSAAAAPAAAPPQALKDRSPSAPWISTHAGWTVWSEDVEGAHFLFARRAGTTKLLPATPSRVTHDPGAGRGPDGRPAAVYQRCSGARCEIWLVDLASGRQRQVRGLGEIRRENARASDEDSLGAETHPRIWGSRLAFKTGGSGKALPRLRVGPSAFGRGAVRTVAVKPGDDGGALKQIAVGPKHVVTFWEDDFCFGRCAGLYIHGLASGRQQLLDDAGGNADCAAELGDIRFDGSAFRWTRELTAIESGSTRCPGTIANLRYNPSTGRRTAS